MLRNTRRLSKFSGLSTSCFNCTLKQLAERNCKPRSPSTLLSYKISDVRSISSFSSTPIRKDISLNEGEKKMMDDLFRRLQKGERSALARSITLMESVHPRKRAQARLLLDKTSTSAKKKLERQGKQSLALRIGFSGPPGAGKSSFIDTLGTFVVEKGHKVAVLAVDPSSMRSGGSLLGDKTRMPNLANDPRAYIRASPSSGTLGGVTRTTNEAILLCEAAGYDMVFVETVGVGQSEVAVSDMVDLFLLLVPPAAGDELQGVKRGIMEHADLVIVTKSDGPLTIAARHIAAEYTSAIKIMRKRSRVWKPKVLKVSARTGVGVPELWSAVKEFRAMTLEAGELQARRQRQRVQWMWRHIDHDILSMFRHHPAVKPVVADVERRVMAGEMDPGSAADHLVTQFSSV